jgi:hypothetical protein
MTRIEALSGRGCPRLYCDVCGGRIDDARLAMAAWDFDARKVHHVHKGQCLELLERKMTAEDDWRLCTEELTAHLLQLAGNHLPELALLIESSGWHTALRPEALEAGRRCARSG